MTSDEPDPGQDVEQAEVERLARQAEDEAAAARARADAAAARAAELREQVRATTGSDTRSDSRSDVAPEAAAVRRGLAAAIAAVVITALVSATALMLWAHRDAARQRHEPGRALEHGHLALVHVLGHDQFLDAVQHALAL